ncbi:hypothetical protein [Acidovorax sp. Root267]|uniref:hypothetical protein n=1 Tax=Acidovorax sp. Root267 TaxID=1736505 RepID=UPI000AC43189|nr:hypothetical protein [Acidovorax sp. Root267]
MDAILSRTISSRLIPSVATSQEFTPSAAAPPSKGIAKGMVQHATQAPATPSAANTGFFTNFLQWVHAGRFPYAHFKISSYLRCKDYCEKADQPR